MPFDLLFCFLSLTAVYFSSNIDSFIISKSFQYFIISYKKVDLELKRVNRKEAQIYNILVR